MEGKKVCVVVTSGHKYFGLLTKIDMLLGTPKWFNVTGEKQLYKINAQYVISITHYANKS